MKKKETTFGFAVLAMIACFAYSKSCAYSRQVCSDEQRTCFHGIRYHLY